MRVPWAEFDPMVGDPFRDIWSTPSTIFVPFCKSSGPCKLLRHISCTKYSSIRQIQTGFESGQFKHTSFFITATCLLVSRALETYLTFLQYVLEPHSSATLNLELAICFHRSGNIREIKRLSALHFGDHLLRGINSHLHNTFPSGARDLHF